MATSHFAATTQSDVVRVCAHDFPRHGDAFGTTENASFRAFITLRSQFHLHHCSQRTLTEIVSKITANLMTKATPPPFAPERGKERTQVGDLGLVTGRVQPGLRQQHAADVVVLNEGGDVRPPSGCADGSCIWCVFGRGKCEAAVKENVKQVSVTRGTQRSAERGG